MTTLTGKAVRFITAAALGLGLLWSAPSRGAPPNTIGNSVAVCDPWNPQRCATPDTSGNLPVTGTFSATLGGFAPTTTGTPINVTTGGDTGTLPAGVVVAVFNVGTTNTAYCKLGASATTSDVAIPPASWFAFTVGAATQLTCITASSSTTVNMVGGSGLPTGAGGGGGGGGGPVTVADGADAAEGAIADAAATAGSTGTISAKLRLMTTQLDNINTNVQGSIPAGSAVIGKVGIDQTTPGTTNAVSATNFPTTVSTGTGAQGASSPRVTVATDQATNAGAALKNGGVGVVNGASAWETVAASQTGQALGATGGAGDYLSHCVIYPTSTTPGVVTVFDDTSSAANNVIAFPGGASSVSNLVPISIPVGAISVSGAWKVTTGANLVVTCYGKFT